MKAKVLKAYTDRETREVRLAGDEVELTEARLAELSVGGFVEAAQPDAEAAEAPAGGEPPADEAPALADMTNAELRAYIEKRGGKPPKKANKAALVAAAGAL